MERDTITALTVLVRVYRELRKRGIYDVPIKWNVTSKAMKLRGLMDQINTEYDGGIEQASEHLADVKSVKGTLGDLADDLSAAANVMGNSSNEPEKLPEVPKLALPPNDLKMEPGALNAVFKEQPATQQPGSAAPPEPAA